jgi:hypothetical protein
VGSNLKDQQLQQVRIPMEITEKNDTSRDAHADIRRSSTRPSWRRIWTATARSALRSLPRWWRART